MPQAERYEPTGELHVFDGGEDVDAPEEEGSRLALLLVLALFVLGAFAGVVYLAYSQGVKQGRDESPRAVAQSTLPPQKATPARKLIAPESNTADSDLANEASAPPPPTIAPAPKSPPQPRALTQNVAPKPAPAVTAQLKPSASIANKSPAVKSIVAETPASPKTLPKAAVTIPSPPKALPHTAAPTPPPASASETARAPRSIAPAFSPPAQTKLAQAAAPKPSPQVATSAPPSTPPPSTPGTTASTAPSPAKPATSPATATTEPAKTAGGYVLQIGAYKSEAEAMASWRAYKAAHPTAANYEPDIRQVELAGKGTWYRLRIGSFTSPTDANTLCAKLKAGGASCFPARR